MTKPTRNRIWCPDCRRPKMLFETERKASDFIKWNGDEIYTHNGMLRAYYCPACCGWHISHHEHKESYDTNTDNLLGAYRRNISKHGKNRIDRLLTGDGKHQVRLAEKNREDDWHHERQFKY